MRVEAAGKIRMVGMVIPLETGPAEPAAIEQRGMVEAVLEDVIALTEQGAERADIRRITAAEEQRTRSAGEISQRRFEFLMGSGMAGDQVRGTAAHTPAVHTGLEGSADARIGGETEIVVAAEVEQPPAVDQQLAAGRRLDHAPAAIELPFCQGRERRRYVVKGCQEVFAVLHTRQLKCWVRTWRVGCA